VTAKEAPVKASFAGDQAMVMGDLVPLDREVPAVMACLFRWGSRSWLCNVTADMRL